MAKKELGEKDYIIEFNDSVLSTQTWNNPRYDGCETKTQELNKFTTGDISYGKRTAVQKYTRNIYVGEAIINASGSDDSNLTLFSGFSYVTTTKFITINDNDSLDIRSFIPSIPEEKTGFYRTFLEDFSIGSECQVYLLNEGIINSLDDQYEIYFNEGKLKQIAYFSNDNYPESPISGSAIGPITSGFNFIYSFDSTIPNYELNTFNFNLGPDLYSISNFTPPPSLSTNDFSIVDDFFEKTILSRQETDNRFFITITTGSSYTDALILNDSGSKLLSLSTSEFYRKGRYGNFDFLLLMNKYPLDTNYTNNFTYSDTGNIGYSISRLDTSIPSILINLNKPEQLPNGFFAGQNINNIFNSFPSQRSGPKFIIIPGNLHPYIKDNINYFLNKADLIEGTGNNRINPKNRQLS